MNAIDRFHAEQGIPLSTLERGTCPHCGPQKLVNRYLVRYEGMLPRCAVCGSLIEEIDPRRVILIGCVKQKLAEPAQARDLYVSPLFRGRRAYAEESGLPWAIVSAKHGLVWPGQLLSPYEAEASSWSKAKRAEFGTYLADKISAWIRPLDEHVTIEIHAGAPYVEGIERELPRRCNAQVDLPMRGMQIGEQLRFYADQRSVAA